MLLGTLGASKNLSGKGTIGAREGTIRAGYVSKKAFIKKIVIPPHPLTNFEMQAYYQDEPRFNGVYSRDNLNDKIKDCAYVINLDEYHDIGTYWVALYVNNKSTTYFDSFGVEHIPKEIEKIYW